jgi:Domain of unknown function (DUF5658)
MSLRFWCARCGRTYEVPRSLAGRRVRCRACGHVQPIPAPVDPVGTPVPASTAAPSPSPNAPAPSARAPAAEPEPPPPPPPASPRRPSRQPSSSWREHLIDVAIDAGRLQGLSLVLLTLSITDLFVTFALLRTSPRFYESNPVALWIFRRWNIAGMTIFKFSAIAVAIALGEVIERRRPGWGKAVLLVGCAATAAVVWHGLRLYLGFEPMPIAGAD